MTCTRGCYQLWHIPGAEVALPGTAQHTVQRKLDPCVHLTWCWAEAGGGVKPVRSGPSSRSSD